MAQLYSGNPDLKADLNFYFNYTVTIRRDSSAAARQVTHEYVDKLLSFISKQDPRFGSEPLKVGSASERLKVGEPDEFDFGVCLQDLPQYHWGNSPNPPRMFALVKVESRHGFRTYTEDDVEAHETVPDNMTVVGTHVPLPPPPTGYVILKFHPSSRPRWQGKEDMHFDDYIIPFLVRRSFKKLLVHAVEYLGLGANVDVVRKVSGPAITITINDKRLDKPVSVDFAPTARQNMAFPSEINWPHPNTQWPKREKAMAVKEKGVNFVAKRDMDWLISYAEAEHELRENMDEDGGCRSKLLRIMKGLKDDVFCQGGKPLLSSYHLKNLLFWECERYPQSSAWAQDQLAVRFSSMLQRLVECLRDRSLPVYFDPRVNMLENKDEEKVRQVLTNIGEFKTNFSKYLRQDG